MSLLRTFALLAALLTGCGGTEASAPPPAPEAPPPDQEISLGSAAEELVVDEEVVTTSALAALGGSSTKSEPVAPKATPAPAKKRVDTGLGLDGARSITPQQIKKVIDRYQAQVTACYERELKRSPGMRGKVVVGFVIGADGRVRPPRIVRNTTGNRAMLPCIKRAVRSWRFPKAEGPADVEYPFSFRPMDF